MKNLKEKLKKVLGFEHECYTNLIEEFIIQIEEYEPLTSARLDIIIKSQKNIANHKNRFFQIVVFFILVFAMFTITSSMLYGNSIYTRFIIINFLILIVVFSPVLFTLNFKAIHRFDKLIDNIKTDSNFLVTPKKASYIRHIAASIDNKKKKNDYQRPFDSKTIAASVYFLRKANKFPISDSTMIHNIALGDFLYLFTGCSADIRKYLDNPFLKDTPETNMKRIEEIKDSFHKIGYHDSDILIDKEYNEQKSLFENRKKKKFF